MRFLSSLFFWLPFAMASNSTYTPCTTLCLDRAPASKLAEIKLRLFTGSTVDDYTEVVVGESMKIYQKLDHSKATAVFIFGWLGNPKMPSCRAITEAFIQRGDYNFVMLNWDNISPSEYTYAARSVEGVGYTLAVEVLNKWVAAGLNTTGLNIIGHSLGAQICGYTGRNVNFTLPRITGLDPAGPGFYVTAEHLSATDAVFVIIIHTDAGILGIDLQTGHVDFYPNGGTSDQPGCSIGLDICSHYRAIYLMADSVRRGYENSFIGVSCASYAAFKTGECSSNQRTIMGLATPRNASGRYYLQTNSTSPFGEREAGTRYSPPSSLIETVANTVTSIF